MRKGDTGEEGRVAGPTRRQMGARGQGGLVVTVDGRAIWGKTGKARTTKDADATTVRDTKNEAISFAAGCVGK